MESETESVLVSESRELVFEDLESESVSTSSEMPEKLYHEHFP